MAQLADNHALLLFRAGPVLCCAPTLCVATLISPPSLNHPPGSSDSRPGIFRHDGQLVSLIDLRHLFGVEEAERKQPGRIIICQQTDRCLGFWVDEIIDVIKTPGQGWGQIALSLSDGIFSRSLLLDEKIYLYCEFEKLPMIRRTGFLKPWIQQLNEKNRLREEPPAHATASPRVLDKKPGPAKTSIESHTMPPPVVPPLSSTDSDPHPPLSAWPIKQHCPDAGDHKVDKIQPTHTRAATKNAIQTENKKNQSATPLKAGHSTPPSTHASLVSHASESSFSRQPPHPPNHNVYAQQADQTGTNLPFVAVVLICIGLISAIAYLWPDHTTNPGVTQSANNRPMLAAPAATPPRSHHPKNSFDPITETTLDNDPASTSVSTVHEAQNSSENRYQANIEKHPHEVTIILTAPANDSVIRGDNDSPVAHRQVSATHSTPGPSPALAPVSPRHLPGQHIDEVVHIVVRGDTLWHIARRYIHNPFRYPELARLNKIPNPNLIYPGDRVRIIRIYR